MDDYALVLYPDDPTVALETGVLEAALTELGLLAALLPPEKEQGRWFAAGEPLLELVTFLGCSPVISLAAVSSDNRFCRIHLPSPLPQPVCRVHQPKPRCPRCRSFDVDWYKLLPAWERDPLAVGWTCQICGHKAPLHRLRFREEAGFGRTFVELWGIYPGEAVPGEALLDALSQLTTTSWHWFYIHHTTPGTGLAHSPR